MLLTPVCRVLWFSGSCLFFKQLARPSQDSWSHTEVQFICLLIRHQNGFGFLFRGIRCGFVKWGNAWICDALSHKNVLCLQCDSRDINEVGVKFTKHQPQPDNLCHKHISSSWCSSVSFWSRLKTFHCLSRHQQVQQVITLSNTQTLFGFVFSSLCNCLLPFLKTGDVQLPVLCTLNPRQLIHWRERPPACRHCRVRDTSQGLIYTPTHL